MDLKLLHKYPRVKGFKALHICNPVKHAETAQTLVRFLISIVLSPLWKGKQMPATKHSNTTAFSEASQFIIGDIKWQWNMFCHSSFVLVWTTSLLLSHQVVGPCIGTLLAWNQKILPSMLSLLDLQQPVLERGRALVNRSQRDYSHTDLVSSVPCPLRYLESSMYFTARVVNRINSQEKSSQ